ncbi:MAG: hypothetical protein ACKVZ6_14240 [Kineosporiaceae bacterium]|jgi:hypothetical protein
MDTSWSSTMLLAAQVHSDDPRLGGVQLVPDDVTDADCTVVPLGLLVGALPALSVVAGLAVGGHA